MIVIAGMNGAGKSTCFQKYISYGLPDDHLHFDPDAIEKELRAVLQDCLPPGAKSFSKLAQEECNRLRINCLNNQIDFSFETVFSDPVGDKLNFLKKARSQGYLVVLLGVGLCSAEKSQERVALRVQRGGHSVPAQHILDRYPRVLKNLDSGVKIASLALLVDNSDDTLCDDGDSYHAFAIFQNGVLVEKDTFPSWWPVTGEITRL